MKALASFVSAVGEGEVLASATRREICDSKAAREEGEVRSPRPGYVSGWLRLWLLEHCGQVQVKWYLLRSSDVRVGVGRVVLM